MRYIYCHNFPSIPIFCNLRYFKLLCTNFPLFKNEFLSSHPFIFLNKSECLENLFSFCKLLMFNASLNQNKPLQTAEIARHVKMRLVYYILESRKCWPLAMERGLSFISLLGTICLLDHLSRLAHLRRLEAI